MSELEIIDAHHHLTDLRWSYPWLEGPVRPRYHGDDRPLRRSYSLDEYLDDADGYLLLGSVHVENGAADPLAESHRIDAVHRERGLPSVHVARVSLLETSAPDHLRLQSQIHVVRGVRDILNWHPDPVFTHRDRGDIMTDPTWSANFALLEGYGLSFDLQVFPSQLLGASELAARFPGIRIVLDHAGMPIDRRAAARQEWATGMRALAGRENVVTKISALGTNDHHWTRESIAPFVQETIELFGPRRTMFGSNFPVDGLYSSFRDLIAAFDSLTADLSEAERRRLFVETAAETYGITPSPAHRTPQEGEAPSDQECQMNASSERDGQPRPPFGADR